MALPKKRTSKSRTKRRFSQYVYNQKRKLERVIDRLKHIDAPVIFDSSTVVEASKNKRIIKVDADKSKKIKVEKVEKIDIKKKTTDKKVTDNKKDQEKDKSAKTSNKDKQDDKKWFSNLFQSKNKGGGNIKDIGGKSQKKMFRRKSI